MTRHLLIAGAAIAAFSLAACGQPADQSATAPAESVVPDANPAATIPTPADETAAPDFVRLAAQSDMLEIQSSQLAVERAQDSEVKSFAQMMVEAHAQTTQDLKTAVEAAGQSITLPTTADEDVTEELNELRQEEATDFDKEYIDLQVETHQEALNLMQRYAADGDMPGLQAFAAATAPAIQQHLDQAKAIQDRLANAR
jgi:putative membrane protein